jgi:8-oxo-dGTP diphosphatase
VDDDGRMIFRLRVYRVSAGMAERFDSFFLERLLPVQRRHGARLVGRWRNETGDEVTALWAYRDRAEYERISAAVRDDPQMTDARRLRGELGALYDGVRESFLVSTVPLDQTSLGHLEDGAA